jgi:hypothetical protein
VSPCHPRPFRACSGTPDERNARKTVKKLPACHVAPTCQRERLVVVLIVSSSAHRCLPRASPSVRCKSCHRWMSSHTARRVNARPPIYRGLPRIWPATFTDFSPNPLSTSPTSYRRAMANNGSDDDGAANNGFGRRFLHQWEGRLLYTAGYPAPPNFHAPGGWRLSADGVPIPTPPSTRSSRA